MKKIISKLFRFWLSKLDRFDVGDGRGDVFFSRYDLVKRGNILQYSSIYLHEFFRSDYDRCLHDHPWNFRTIILWGGYWEVTSEGRFWRRPGYTAYYPATHKHRIELDPSRSRVWSLVLVGRKIRPWGFWGPDGWQQWEPGYPNPICND